MIVFAALGMVAAATASPQVAEVHDYLLSDVEIRNLISGRVVETNSATHSVVLEFFSPDGNYQKSGTRAVVNGRWRIISHSIQVDTPRKSQARRVIRDNLGNLYLLDMSTNYRAPISIKER